MPGIGLEICEILRFLRNKMFGMDGENQLAQCMQSINFLSCKTS